MHFIKLTRVSENPIHINPDHIIDIRSTGAKATIVTLTGGGEIYVVETAQEIIKKAQNTTLGTLVSENV